ncbi:hypothetical protein EJ02DRAFT_463030 [Clathrospora elynae]|uniref:Uncharacterized protein n=1 Tax=Clathrospora elynae TaxID=706981 RepID=A0A6A5SZF7_9PLEO|nr:hypothetical protein EJ02DRAFT_463030 [Clathrospora elynae]
MLVTGVILIPTVMATPAVQDLVDLRNVINAAASAIGDPNNPNRGFGFNMLGNGGQMGTADLVNNVTTTILRGKWQLDTNKTGWLLPDNLANTSIPLSDTAPPSTPTLPLSSSLVLPSVLPTSTSTLNNLTIDLSTPYTDYVSSIPNLSTSLVALGRSYHREMNSPVSTAIDALEQSVTTMQTAMLESGLIDSQAIIRTIRANAALADAQQAWSHSLNLPGGDSDDNYGSSDAPAATGVPMFKKRGEESGVKRPPPADGKFYTHQELWNRSEPRARQSMEGKARPYDVIVKLEGQHGRTAENARVGLPFDA